MDHLSAFSLLQTNRRRASCGAWPCTSTPASPLVLSLRTKLVFERDRERERERERTNERFIELGRLPMSNREVGDGDDTTNDKGKRGKKRTIIQKHVTHNTRSG